MGALWEHFGKQQEETSADPSVLADLKQQLVSLGGGLREIQGDTPLMQPAVDEQSIAEVIANWTGIPVGKMVNDEIAADHHLTRQLDAGKDLHQLVEHVINERADLAQ